MSESTPFRLAKIKKKEEIQNQVEEIAFYSIFSNSVCLLIDKNIV